ncbi:hypothetical protein CcaverHIS002_0310410 [Cutaneotrichosporon cavernicola]|nr:hypothetical protein CcaverHIS002_0310410 [Cutaneotrichosporon cavernicola]
MSEPSPAPMDNASHFEEQLLRVIARQNLQDGELEALSSQVTDLHAKLRAMGSNLATPPLLPKAETERMPDPLSRLEARMDRQDAQMRALTLSIQTLAAKISEQNSQRHRRAPGMYWQHKKPGQTHL